MSKTESVQRNVLGEPLKACGYDPMTGFYRDGCCHVGRDDVGVHAVCSEVTRDFLDYSAARGNDLATPHPEVGFEGLLPGDRWCLCAARWKEAFEAGCAPRIVLQATHEAMLEYVDLAQLKPYAVDLN